MPGNSRFKVHRSNKAALPSPGGLAALAQALLAAHRFEEAHDAAEHGASYQRRSNFTNRSPTGCRDRNISRRSEDLYTVAGKSEQSVTAPARAEEFYLRVTAPRSTAPDERIGYELTCILPTNPRLIRLRKDVLDEYEFAPGNPW